MGFNTAISICNDNLGDYRRHPDKFVDILWRGINDGADEWGVIVHPSEHADATQLVAVGGNFSTRLLSDAYYTGSHHTRAGQVALLQALADKLGYALVPAVGTPVEQETK